MQCPGEDSNLHGILLPPAPQAGASANFATWAPGCEGGEYSDSSATWKARSHPPRCQLADTRGRDWVVRGRPWRRTDGPRHGSGFDESSVGAKRRSLQTLILALASNVIDGRWRNAMLRGMVLFGADRLIDRGPIDRRPPFAAPSRGAAAQRWGSRMRPPSSGMRSPQMKSNRTAIIHLRDPDAPRGRSRARVATAPHHWRRGRQLRAARQVHHRELRRRPHEPCRTRPRGRGRRLARLGRRAARQPELRSEHTSAGCRMLRINEIFFSIQGESTHAGHALHVRASDRMPPAVHVLRHRVRVQGGRSARHRGDRPDTVLRPPHPSLVEITGGEPLLQPGRPRADDGSVRRGVHRADRDVRAPATSRRATTA